MNMLEEIASIVMRIRELRARIECSEDRSITWLEQVELAEGLRRRCEAGALRFDLSAQSLLSPESAREESGVCTVAEGPSVSAR